MTCSPFVLIAYIRAALHEAGLFLVWTSENRCFYGSKSSKCDPQNLSSLCLDMLCSCPFPGAYGVDQWYLTFSVTGTLTRKILQRSSESRQWGGFSTFYRLWSPDFFYPVPLTPPYGFHCRLYAATRNCTGIIPLGCRGTEFPHPLVWLLTPTIPSGETPT